MKILFVAHSGKISGGANRSLLSVMTGLKEKYDIVPSVMIPEDGSDLEKCCREKGIKTISCRYHTCCTVFKKEPMDILRLFKIIAAPMIDMTEACRINKKIPEEFDLIYTNDRMTVIGGYLSRLRKIPHIWHVRSFSKENSIIYMPGYYHLMDQYSDKIVLISRALYNSFSSHISKEKLVMIHNGIDVAQYSLKSREEHEGFNILLTGRIVPPKGQIEAVKALLVLREEYGITAELFLAGEIPAYGSGDYYREIDRFIHENNLTGHVHFLGEIEKMTDVRKKMDLELVCSWCEAFGRVTIEAMSAGLPVIAANTGGTMDIIEDRKSGLLYESRNVSDLASKIAWIYRNPEGAEKLSEAGYSRVYDSFTIDQTVDRIRQVIIQTVK